MEWANSLGLDGPDQIKSAILSSGVTGADLVGKVAPMIASAGLRLSQSEELIKMLASASGVGVGICRREVDECREVESSSDMQQSEAADKMLLPISAAWAWDSVVGAWYHYTVPHWSRADTSALLREAKQRLKPLVGGFSASYLAGVASILRLELSSDDHWSDDSDHLPMINGLLPLNDHSHGVIPYPEESRWTWRIPIEYHPGTPAPVFDKWIEFLSDGDEQQALVLLCCMAAIIRGISGMQVFIEATGEGGTGKGAFQHLCCSLVGGENVVSSDLRSLEHNRFESFRLYGKRLVVFADAGHYDGGMETFKRITGGDPVRGEAKHNPTIANFTYDGMVLVTGNQPIEGNDLSSGIVRRRIPLRFDKHPPEADEQFYSKLDEELPGIINRLLDIDTDEIRRTISGHRDSDHAKSVVNDTNHLVAFVTDALDSDPDGRPLIGDGTLDINGSLLNAGTDIYPTYLSWCAADGVDRRKILNKRGFAAKLDDSCRIAGIDCWVKKDWATERRGKKAAFGVRIRCDAIQ